MAYRINLLVILAVVVQGAPDKLIKPVTDAGKLQKVDEKQDLKTASSSYSHQYSDWRGANPSGYEFSVTGHGIVDDRAVSNLAGVDGYNKVGYASPGFSANSGFAGSPGFSASPGFAGSPGYSAGYGGYKGYDGLGQSGYGGYEGSFGGYQRKGGYGNIGYSGYNGYAGNRGYGLISGGNGGYGGYGGNGGLSSYYGYNNPYYQENNHLGYGYYNKRPGYGSIYNSGITPSLVTGYRGYSR